MQYARPENYRIHLIPDLNRFTFAGDVTIQVQASAAIETLDLNILDLSIYHCDVEQNSEWVECGFETDAEKEELQILLPQKMEGAIRMRIRYEGQINDKMAGFYRSQYTHSGKTRYIAVTQFEESDARRAFPCMDHPAKKATFDVILDIDRDLTAISNGAVKQEVPLDNGKKLEPGKNYKVAGWATVGSKSPGKPVWDVVADYLRDRKSARLVKINQPKLKNVAGNPGLADWV